LVVGSETKPPWTDIVSFRIADPPGLTVSSPPDRRQQDLFHQTLLSTVPIFNNWYGRIAAES
jgi:hypothetical protein